MKKPALLLLTCLLMGWQPVWKAPMRYQLRHVALDGTITVLEDIELRPYGVGGLDQAFFLPAPDGTSATLLYRDDAADSHYVLRTYGIADE